LHLRVRDVALHVRARREQVDDDRSHDGEREERVKENQDAMLAPLGIEHHRTYIIEGFHFPIRRRRARIFGCTFSRWTARE
jgi:hypothetical protein